VANPGGVFDETAVAAGWFDETAQAAGWFDGDLAGAGAAPIDARVSWVQLEVPAAPAAGTQIKTWNGSAWVVGALKRWNGSAWVAATLKRWNGSSWIAV